jgi:hypothetical protein
MANSPRQDRYWAGVASLAHQAVLSFRKTNALCSQLLEVALFGSAQEIQQAFGLAQPHKSAMQVDEHHKHAVLSHEANSIARTKPLSDHRQIPQGTSEEKVDEKEKKEALQRVPTRKLLASIKRDLRKQLHATRAAAKPKKK